MQGNGWEREGRGRGGGKRKGAMVKDERIYVRKRGKKERKERDPFSVWPLQNLRSATEQS